MPTNEYMKIATGLSDNPYAQIATDDHAQTAQAVQASVNANKDIQPEEAARISRLAKELGVGSNLVAQDYSGFANSHTVAKNNYEDIARSTPNLASFLKDPDNAAMSKDDLSAMGTLEKNAKEHSLLSDAYNGLMSGVAKMGEGFLNIPGYLIDASNADMRARLKEYGEVAPPTQTSKELGLTAPTDVSKHYQSLMSPNVDAIDALSKGEVAKAGRSLFLQLVQGAPMMAAAMLAGPVAGPAMFGATTAADSNAEGLEAGASPDAAIAGSTLKGAGAAAVQNAFGVTKVLQSWENSMTNLYGKPLTSAVMKEFAKTFAYSAGGDALAFGAQAGASDVTDYLTGLNPKSFEGIGGHMLNSALFGASMGGSMSLFGLGASRLAGKAHDVRQANLTKDFYLAFGKDAAALKLRERLPEAQRAYIDEAVSGTGTENVYIPVEAFQSFNQSKKVLPEVAAQELGVLKEYNAAAESGEDMQIPLGLWAQKMAHTDGWAELADDIKFDPAKPSLKEAKAQHEETARDVIEEAKRAKEADDTFNKQKKFVADDVTSQLQSIGYSQREAKINAILHGEFFGAMSEQANVTPSDLYQDYGLKISDNPEMQATAAQTALNQAAKPEVLAKLEELLPRTGDKAKDDAAREALQKDPEKYKEYLATLDQLGTRRERAEAMGFNADEIVYHGTLNGSFSEFDRARGGETSGHGSANEGIYFSPDRNVARNYTMVWDDALQKPVKAPNAKIGEYFLKAENTFVFDARDIDDSINAKEMRAIVKEARDGGYDSVRIEHAPGETEFTNPEGRSETIMIPDPTQVRERFAAFDPRFADSAQLLAQKGEGENRAQIRFGADRQFNIDLFKSRDASSFAHESAHFFLEVMGDLAERKDVSQSLKDDYATILKWLGVEDRAGIKTDQHEQWARGFERFLMEGKAPSTALRKAFNTFKTWLTSIYRSAKALDVELSPEIRAVMDRMLVSDSQIAKAEETMNYKPLEADPIAVMGEKLGTRYIEAQAKASENANDTIRRKLMDDVRKKDEADYKKVEGEQREAITKELSESRDYRALDILQGRKPAEGDADTLPLLTGVTDLKISKDSVLEVAGQDALNEMPKGTTKGDGVHVEIAAQLLGYRDGKELVESLRNKPKLKDAVKQAVDEKMQELFPDYLLNPNISDDAIQAVHNDNRQQVLRLEMEHLLSNDPKILKDVAKKVIGRMPREEAVKEQARIQIGDRTIKDIRPVVYQRAEVKASREAAKAYAAGDYQAAFEAKRRELLNNELYRSAVEAQGEVEKQVRQFKKLFKSDADVAKTRDIDYVDAARAVLAAHGLAQADKTPQQYLASMAKADPARYETIVDLVNSALENQTGSKLDSYESMKMNDFSAMSDAVNAIWDLAKSSREQTIDGKKVQTDVIVQELIKPLIDQPSRIRDRGKKELTTKAQKFEMALMGVQSKLRRVEHWARVMDNDNINGPYTRAIFRPISEKQSLFILDEAKTRNRLAELIKPLKNETTAIVAPELGEGFIFRDKNQLRHAMLHSGNDSNLTKLLVGRNWGSLNEDGSLDRSNWDAFISRMHREGVITKEDWDFAQNIWNHSEELKPAAQAAHKERYGYRFNEITKRSFETPFGEYEGGYVPAKTDTNEVTRAQKNEDKSLLDANTKMFPTTGRGFTKSRVDNYNKPLALDLNLLPSHFSDVLRFTHLENTVYEVKRLLDNHTFQDQMNAVDPTVINEMLEPWLDRSAKQQIVTPSSGKGGRLIDASAKWLRSSASMQIMTLNVPAAAENLLSFQPAMARLGVNHVLGGYAEMIRDPSGAHEMIISKSKLMETRVGERAEKAKELWNDFVVNPNLYQRVRDAARKGGMILEHATNHFTESAIWLSAYRKGLADNMPEADAVNMANGIVRQTTADMTPAGLSKAETGTPFERLFTMFSGYFVNQGNNMVSEAQLAKKMGLTTGAGSKRALMGYAMMILGPAVTSGLIKRAFKGQNLLDANEDGHYFDDAVDIFGMGQLQYMTAMVPGGSTLNAVLNRFNDNPFDDKINISPAASIAETTFAAPGEIKKYVQTGQGEAKALRDGLTALGLISGLPTGLVAKPLGYLADVQEGKARPTGPIDFTRGIITGKPGGKAKY